MSSLDNSVPGDGRTRTWVDGGWVDPGRSPLCYLFQPVAEVRRRILFVVRKGVTSFITSDPFGIDEKIFLVYFFLPFFLKKVCTF